MGSGEGQCSEWGKGGAGVGGGVSMQQAPPPGKTSMIHCHPFAGTLSVCA